MRIISKFRSGFADFRRGLSVIFGKSDEGEGDRKLAKMSKIVIGQIPLYGKVAVRKQVIKSIEGDFRRTAKKGGKSAVEKLIQNALGTPEYKQLLRKLDLDESHIRVISMEVLKSEK